MFKFLQIAVTALSLLALAQPALAGETAADKLNRAVLENIRPLAEAEDMPVLAAEMNTIKPASGYALEQDAEEAPANPDALSYYGEDSVLVDAETP